jgi:hypothetical protein
MWALLEYNFILILQGMGWNVNEMLFKESGAWPHTPIIVWIF